MVNNTTVSSSNHQTGCWSYFLAAVCVLVFIVGLFGNSIVVFVYYHKRKLQTFELLVVNLAIADTIGTVIMPTYTLVRILKIPLTFMGGWGCKILAFLWGVSIGLSAITLVLITVHRFMLIRWPLRKRTTPQQCYWLIAGFWLFGCIIYSPFLIRNSIRMREGFCYESTPSKWYVFCVLTVEMVIPISVMTVLYTMVILMLRTKKQSSLLATLKRNRRPIKLIIVVTVLFYVCYVPISVIHILTLYRIIKDEMVIWTAVVVQVANSCVNPFIYCKMEVEFRRDLVRMLSRTCCCTHHKKSQKIKVNYQTGRVIVDENSKIHDRHHSVAGRSVLP